MQTRCIPAADSGKVLKPLLFFLKSRGVIQKNGKRTPIALGDRDPPVALSLAASGYSPIIAAYSAALLS
jgi:hypothetical protein